VSDSVTHVDVIQSFVEFINKSNGDVITANDFLLVQNLTKLEVAGGASRMAIMQAYFLKRFINTKVSTDGDTYAFNTVPRCNSAFRNTVLL
jgi:hypothetical protein